MDRRTEADLLKLAERCAVALEKLGDDPVVEIEAGPALCPHCGKMNPTVAIMPTEGTGPLLDWVLVAECTHCNHTFFGLVESWGMYATSEMLQADLEERRAGNDDN